MAGLRTSGSGNDGHEVRRLEAGAADKSAIDVRDFEDLARVRRLDRPSVKDPHALALNAVTLHQPSPNGRVHLADFARGRDFPGPDCPYRLVSDREFRVAARTLRERAIELRD